MSQYNINDKITDEDATTIAQKWLTTSASTATNRQFEEHFNLVSKKVKITGVPGYESISYDDWSRQSEKDFKEGLLESVSYESFKLVATNERQIMFKTIETICGTDGTKRAHGVEILLAIEEDGVWRVTQERVQTDDESRHDGLM
jgi:hypothetical protein